MKKDISKIVSTLKGKVVRLYIMGVEEPSTFVLKNASGGESGIQLEAFNGGVDIIPRDKVVDFLKGEIVMLKDSKEPYALQLLRNVYEVGGVVKSFDSPIITMGMQNEFSEWGGSTPMSKFAKGGMSEHGLRVGDKVLSGKIIGTTIRVRNENNDEDAKVDLNNGKRTKLKYDKNSKKFIEMKADGGSISKEFIWTYDVSFSHGKRNQPQQMGRHWVTVSSTTEKGALREAKKQIRKLYEGEVFSKITPRLVSKETYEESLESERKSREKFGFSKGGEIQITNQTIDRGGLGQVQDSILRRGGISKQVKKVGKQAIKKAKPISKELVRRAKIGFKALAKKVAKAYEGKAVKTKYKKLYGKTYSKAEAEEVGNKVASKVYRQQQAKK